VTQAVISRPWQAAALLAGLLLLAVALYLPSAGAPSFLREGEALKALTSSAPAGALGFQEHPDESRPLANLVRYVLLRATGADSSIRIASALLHGLTAWLLILLCRSLMERDGGNESASLIAPVAGAVIFLVHPLASEALLAHAAFPIVMATALACLSLLLAARGAAARSGLEGTHRPRVGASIAYLAACMCDAAVWPLGLVAAAISRPAPGHDHARRGLLRSLWPFVVAAALFYASWVVRLWPAVHVLEVRRVWGFLRGVASQSAAYLAELRLIVLPWGKLSVNHGNPVFGGSWEAASIAGVIMLILTIAGGLVALGNPRLPRAAFAAFALLHLHFVLIPPAEPLLERRLYLLMPGVALLASAAWLAVERRLRATATLLAAAAAAGALLMLTSERVHLWKDPVRLWESASLAEPQSSIPHVALGNLKLSQGEYDLALQSFDLALARSPRSASIQQNIAEVYARRGDYQRAAAEAGKAINLDPTHFPSYITAGIAFMMRNQPRDAFLMFNEALRLRPTDPTALYNMGALFYDQQRYVQAAQLLKQSLNARPHDADTLFRLGMSSYRAGDVNGAVEALSDCLEEAPGRLDARINLAGILVTLHREEEARQSLEVALQAEPENEEAMKTMAVIATRQSRWQEARSLLEKAAAKDPNDLRTVYNLAGVYESMGDKARAIEAYKTFLDHWDGAMEVGEDARARLVRLESGTVR
jgi:tetratricopeptide (TPR) repeat protein